MTPVRMLSMMLFVVLFTASCGGDVDVEVEETDTTDSAASVFESEPYTPDSIDLDEGEPMDGPAEAVGGDNAANSTPAAPEADISTMPEQEAESTVFESISEEPGLGNVKVRMEGTTVVLTGSVDFDAMKQLAEQTARALGASAVRNEIVVNE